MDHKSDPTLTFIRPSSIVVFDMVEFSKNNVWKYSTIALAAILAVGVSFPEAIAQSSNAVLGIVQDIQAKVNSSVFGLSAIKTAVDTKASQTSVTTLQTTANAIKAKTDNLPSNPASQTDLNNAVDDIGHVKSLRINLSSNPANNGVELRQLIQAEEGKTFSGHITGIIATNPNENTIRLWCQIGTGSIPLNRSDHPSSSESLNMDFACGGLEWNVFDIPDDGINGGPAELNAMIQYVESSDVTDMP